MTGCGAFTDYAERLVKNGFTVTPTKGKVPIVRRWQNPKPTDPQWLGRMLAANRYAGYDLGIVCGRVVGIDIDTIDVAKVQQIAALAAEQLGPTPFQRVGRAPRTLLLYRPKLGEIIDSISKLAGCIDVLSSGRQFVAFGVHPNTGKPYHWHSLSPATAKIDDLPGIDGASLRAFANAICKTVGSPVKGLPALNIHTVAAGLQTRQRACQGELGNPHDSRIIRDANGRVVDGREAFMAKLTAAEFAKRTHQTPEELGMRIWSRFIEEADLAHPKGSKPAQRWTLKDALSKARSICRRNPNLKPPRRSRRGHPASHLHAWRKPGFWTAAQRELHLAEVGRRITTPATLAVARVMIDAVDVSGFCIMPIAEIAMHSRCSLKSVKTARATLRDCGLWIAGPGGVFVPLAGLNSNQATEKTKRKRVRGTTKGAPLYHLVVSDPSFPALPPTAPVITATLTRATPCQPDMFGALVLDLATYRRGLLPADIGAAVRAEMRARGVTQDELAGQLGISQPQLANALAGRFGLSTVAAARLLEWLRREAACIGVEAETRGQDSARDRLYKADRHKPSLGGKIAKQGIT